MNREQRRSAGQRGPTQHKDATSVLDAMTGHKMPGGCADCRAYQTVEQHTPGVYLLNVWHDDSCPELLRMTR